MKSTLHNLFQTWNDTHKRAEEATILPTLKFEDFTSKIFSLGPHYYFIIDFYDMSISNVCESIKDFHDFDDIDAITLEKILEINHPEDIPFIARTEQAIAEFYYTQLLPEQLLKYKMNYNFRIKVKDGSYALFNHQAILLTLDHEGRFGKSLNIHTRIDHITTTNNYKYSLIGLKGEKSYMNLESNSLTEATPYTKREIEIIKLLAQGLHSKAIASALKISPETVKKHRRNILQKAKAKNTTELISKSLFTGLI